ncbi:hypothetical protein PV325_012876 [Microctonus aethiopoides]|nr:hypothetical protein PV325_012876 [Microctonus aethiopoides]
MGDCNNIDIMTQQLQLLSEKEKKSIKYQDKLQDKVAYLNEKLQDREEKIQKLMSKFEDLKDSFKKQTETNADMNYDKTTQIIRLLDMEESDLVTVENSSEDIHKKIINQDDAQVYQKFQNELEEKTREIMRLTHQLNKLDKESLESREALAIEVAGKHDTVMNLRQQVNKLEENGRQLQMQLHFKEDIIKNMRTEMKLLKTKSAVHIPNRSIKMMKKLSNNLSQNDSDGFWVTSSEFAMVQNIKEIMAINKNIKDKERKLKRTIDMDFCEIAQELHGNRVQKYKNQRSKNTITMGTIALKSPKKSHINASPTSQRVTWSDSTSNETLGEIKAKNNNLLTTLLELKTILISEHSVLKEKIQELHNILYHTTLMEKTAADKYLGAEHSMVDDMLAMMEKYRDGVIENNDQKSLTTNAAFNCNDKLMKVIDTLSDLCMNKNKRILDLEYVIEDARKKNEQTSQSSECKHSICDNSEITRQQFNEMEEFRVCTVEAQAATEDLREEIDVVTCNLNCRNQLFNDLCNSIEKICDIIARTKQNISAVINSVKAHIEEKILANKTIKLGHDKLKDMKNEINEARSKDNGREHEFDIYNKSYDSIMDEVEYIVCNLDVFISKEDYSITLLEELRDHVNSVEDNFEEIQREADRVLQENKIAQKVIDEKTKKLDKLEQELDYAHTRMQETLENIVFINQQNESSNGHSCSTTDDASSIHKSDEHSQLSAAEIVQLKNSLCSKDKLLEHKDEVIRIQKDSIEMTQEEYKDLRQRLQSKIDAQVDIINQCIQEKMKLLEQNQLQNQTIKHLQDAVQGFIIDHDRDIDQEVEHILNENLKLKQRLMAYREDLYTVMKTTKSKTPNEKHHNCKIYFCLQTMDKLQIKLKDYEELLEEYSERLYMAQALLKKKSDELAILKTHHEIINNEYLIMKRENKNSEIRRKDDVTELQYKMNELHNELCIVEDNYQSVCSDLEKSQKHLLEAAKREFDLQQLLTEALANSSKDTTINELNTLLDKLNSELEDTRAELNNKEFDFVQAQDIHEANVDQIKCLMRQIKLLEKRNIELSDMNEYLMQQTQEIDKIKPYLKNNIEKEKVKMSSKKSSKQLLRLSQMKLYGDGVDESFSQVARKIVDRRNKHHFIHPYTSDISLSTCCSIRTITTQHMHR